VKLSNSVKERKIRAIAPFKVIEVGTNRKPVSDFPLVIIDILSRSVWELSQFIVQIEQFSFLSPFRGLGTMYDVYLGLIGKCVVD